MPNGTCTIQIFLDDTEETTRTMTARATAITDNAVADGKCQTKAEWADLDHLDYDPNSPPVPDVTGKISLLVMDDGAGHTNFKYAYN
jgi:hypothetical protein